MANGLNADPLVLWKFRCKVNTPNGSLNWSLHKAECNEADARATFLDIGNRYLALLPSTCEIIYASMTKDNPKKDSRIIPDLHRDGLYGQGGVSPAPTVYNQHTDALLLRFENADGGSVAFKFGPVVDTEILGGQCVHPPDSTIGIPAGVVPATAAQPVVFKTELEHFMQAILKNCHHVVTKNHVPGGTYTYFSFANAHYIRVAKKKGGVLTIA